MGSRRSFICRMRYKIQRRNLLEQKHIYSNFVIETFRSTFFGTLGHYQKNFQNHHGNVHIYFDQDLGRHYHWKFQNHLLSNFRSFFHSNIIETFRTTFSGNLRPTQIESYQVHFENFHKKETFQNHIHKNFDTCLQKNFRNHFHDFTHRDESQSWLLDRKSKVSLFSHTGLSRGS